MIHTDAGELANLSKTNTTTTRNQDYNTNSITQHIKMKKMLSSPFKKAGKRSGDWIR